MSDRVLNPRVLFHPGQCVGTPAALELLQRVGITPVELIDRHVRGDWGDLCREDAEENDLSVREGFRILSAYTLGRNKVWVITEADRSATTILLPEEY